MDIALKQRLVGASVLIAFAVVVLPMLFGGRPDSDAPNAARVEIEKRPDAAPIETRRFPIGEAPAPEAATDVEPRALELPAPSRAAPVETPELAENTDASGTEEPVIPAPVGEEDLAPPPGSDPETSSESASAGSSAEPDAAPVEPAVTEAPPPAASRAASDGRYVVQVASFGSVSNATKLTTRLQGLGYAVMNDTVQSDVGTLNRVRVGPYASESEAERVVARLREQVEGSKPRVMDLQPDRAERVTQPSDPLVRWVVQVGSFSSAANADNLVAKLRLEGHSAYREQVGSAGSTIYRVRVGPFVDRDEAIRADQRINERLSLDGVVMSAD